MKIAQCRKHILHMVDHEGGCKLVNCLNRGKPGGFLMKPQRSYSVIFSSKKLLVKHIKAVMSITQTQMTVTANPSLGGMEYERARLARIEANKERLKVRSRKMINLER